MQSRILGIQCWLIGTYDTYIKLATVARKDINAGAEMVRFYQFNFDDTERMQ